jgi:hypothetical protein
MDAVAQKTIPPTYESVLKTRNIERVRSCMMKKEAGKEISQLSKTSVTLSASMWQMISATTKVCNGICPEPDKEVRAAQTTQFENAFQPVIKFSNTLQGVNMMIVTWVSGATAKTKSQKVKFVFEGKTVRSR